MNQVLTRNCNVINKEVEIKQMKLSELRSKLFKGDITTLLKYDAHVIGRLERYLMDTKVTSHFDNDIVNINKVYTEFLNNNDAIIKAVNKLKLDQWTFDAHLNDKAEVLKSAVSFQSFVVEEDEQGNYILLDGFNRLFILNYSDADFDSDVIVQIYKGITDEEAFNILYSLNTYKYRLNDSGFVGAINRGIIYYLHHKYNLNLVFYNDFVGGLLNIYGGLKIYSHSSNKLINVMRDNPYFVDDLKTVLELPYEFYNKTYSIYTRDKQIKDTVTPILYSSQGATYHLNVMIVNCLYKIRTLEFTNNLERKKINLVDVWKEMNLTEKEMYEIVSKQVAGHIENMLSKKYYPRLKEAVKKLYGYDVPL